MSRIASVGLAVVMVALALLAMWAATATLHAAAHAKAAVLLSDNYKAAARFVGLEQSLERNYRLEPSARGYADFRKADASSVTALMRIRHDGDADDRRIIDAAIALHAAYFDAVTLVFSSVDAGDATLVKMVEHEKVDAVFAAIDRTVTQRGDEQNRRAFAALADLARTEQTVADSTVILSVAGLGLLIFFGLILRNFKVRIDTATQAEMTKLARESLTDNLTLLGNHRAFHEDLASAIIRARRASQSLALAVIDIDDFKLINDQHGHSRGDRVLALLGSLLHRVRAEDRAYRIGGDEFSMLLAGHSVAEVSGLLERLRRSIAEADLGVTVSIGVAYLQRGTDAASFLEQADASLYEAKRRGRNAVVAFSDEHGASRPSYSAKTVALRAIIDNPNLTIAFQPIWDVDSETVLGFEALTRFPIGCGLSGPEEAFQVAERMGRAHELDTACRNAILARARELPAGALLFVNVSPQTLDHDVLAGSSLVSAFRSAGLTPQQVVLEVTERSIARPAVVIAQAKRLGALGFRLALDDVGAGNAGLELLCALPVDFVKVDRAIVVNALRDRQTNSVLAGIITIARQNGSYVIAEGIEDRATLDLVRTPGTSVQGVQGYLLGRPAPHMTAVQNAIRRDLSSTG